MDFCDGQSFFVHFRTGTPRSLSLHVSLRYSLAFDSISSFPQCVMHVGMCAPKFLAFSFSCAIFLVHYYVFIISSTLIFFARARSMEKKRQNTKRQSEIGNDQRTSRAKKKRSLRKYENKNEKLFHSVSKNI